MTRKHNPPKGKVPPQLRRYLFKPGHVPWDKGEHFTERKRNPSRSVIKLDSGYGPIAADWDPESSVLRVRPMSEWEMSQRVKAMGGVKISKDQQTLTFPGDERWAWDPRFNWWAMTKARERNPLPLGKSKLVDDLRHFRAAAMRAAETKDPAERAKYLKAARTYNKRLVQLTRQYRERNPSRSAIHTKKWDDCVKDVKARGGRYDPYAVCTSVLGERGSIKAGHRRKNPSGSKKWRVEVFSSGGSKARARFFFRTQKEAEEFARRKREDISRAGYNMDVIILGDERTKNPSGFQLEKTQRLYFMVHAHPHRGGGERLWLTQSGTLSADKGKGARYTSVEVAVARAKAFLKKHRVARKYRFDVCLSD